jgi:hypothetical protein
VALQMNSGKSSGVDREPLRVVPAGACLHYVMHRTGTKSYIDSSSCVLSEYKIQIEDSSPKMVRNTFLISSSCSGVDKVDLNLECHGHLPV